MTRDQAITVLISAHETLDEYSDLYKAISILRAELKPARQPRETRRVRVAVSVTPGGIVKAYGIDHETSAATALSYCYIGGDYGQAVVECDIPCIPTVPGRLVEGKA